MNVIIMAVLISELTVTSYRSIPKQTDSSPYHTSTNAVVQPGGVAVSRDLLCGACRKLHKRCKHPEYKKRIHYGDWLYVKQYGFRFVNDCMSDTSSIRVKGKVKKRLIRNQIDLWVGSYQEEKAVNVKKLEVFKIEFVNLQKQTTYFEKLKGALKCLVNQKLELYVGNE